MSAREQILTLQEGMAQSIIGQSQVVERILLTLLCNGNLLLEGLPGLAKTRAIKSLAANLEVMEERQVTVAGTTHKLPALFMVLATQNPIEQEGTYPLPEAQTDRFLLHVMIRYPDDATELQVLRLVRDVVHDCLRHRLILSYEANASGLSADDVINAVVKQAAVA